MPHLSLPPIYSQEAVPEGEDPFAIARSRAEQGGARALFVWSEATARATAAIVLEPSRPAVDALKVIYVALVGAGDALGALIPPAVPVLFVWPDRIELDGGLVGSVRFEQSEVSDDEAVPEWIVIGLDLAVESAGESPGDQVDHTTLHDEGCGDVTARMFLESFSRHFLYWINRWESDGFGVVRSSWLSRARGRDGEADFDDVGGPVQARISGFDKDGGVIVKAEDTETVVLRLADNLDRMRG